MAPATDDPVGGLIAVVGAAVIFLGLRALVKVFVVRGLAGKRFDAERHTSRFQREARWMMLGMPVIMGIGLLLALLVPPLLRWLAPSPRASIRWNEDANTHME
jgi:hypothetical protein